MRIWYAFPEPLPLPRARGIQAVNTAAALAAAGALVTLAFVPARAQKGLPAEPFAAYGVKPPEGVRLLGISRSLPWPLSSLHSNRLFAARLEAELQSAVRPHAVFVRHPKLAALLGPKIAGVPIVYEAHEVFAVTAGRRRAANIARIEERALRAAVLVVANSGATARELAVRYGLEATIPVVPNGVDWPEPLPRKEWAEASRRIVYAGSFFDWKGITDLAAAAGHLPDHRITLVGGDLRELEGRVGRLPEGGAELHCVARVSHAEVMRHLYEACVAVLPNRADAQSRFSSPIKLFEYMAAGCAVVATDIGSVREILGPEDAVWVRPGDPRSLAEGIRALCADPGRAQAIGARLRERAKAFTWHARGERLKALIEKVVASDPASG